MMTEHRPLQTQSICIRSSPTPDPSTKHPELRGNTSRLAQTLVSAYKSGNNAIMGLSPAGWVNQDLPHKRYSSLSTEMPTDIAPLQCSANHVPYPTPPYASLRENIPKVFIVPVERKRFLDMIKKFDPNDLSYVYFSTNEVVKEVWTIDKQTSIMDVYQKSFVVENGTLWAKSLQGQNVNLKAKFIMGIGSIAQGEKTPVSLKIYNTNQQLSYQSGALRVQPLTQNTIDYANPDDKKFFFFIKQTGSVTYSFEPVMAPNLFLSTAQGNSPVTVQPLSANSYNKEFKFDSGYFIPGVLGSVSRFEPSQERKPFGIQHRTADSISPMANRNHPYHFTERYVCQR